MMVFLRDGFLGVSFGSFDAGTGAVRHGGGFVEREAVGSRNERWRDFGNWTRPVFFYERGVNDE